MKRGEQFKERDGDGGHEDQVISHEEAARTEKIHEERESKSGRDHLFL